MTCDRTWNASTLALPLRLGMPSISNSIRELLLLRAVLGDIEANPPVSMNVDPGVRGPGIEKVGNKQKQRVIYVINEHAHIKHDQKRPITDEGICSPWQWTSSSPQSTVCQTTFLFLNSVMTPIGNNPWSTIPSPPNRLNASLE